MLNIEVLRPALRELIDPEQELREIVSGCEFTEGPIWHPGEKHFTFSDTRGNRTCRWSERDGFSVVRPYSNSGNGSAYDAQGRIVMCEHFTHRVVRMNTAAGDYEVMASHYEGRELNSPNDVVVKSDGMIYFTDPYFGRRPTKSGIVSRVPQPVQGVYLVDPDSREVVLATAEVDEPNGLAFSPDESLCYVADTSNKRVVVFDVAADGRLVNPRDFCHTLDRGPGLPDGIRIDRRGNLYLTAQGGVHFFNPAGECLGILVLTAETGNLCFGDEDLKTLYICHTGSIYTVRTKIPGALLPHLR